MPGEFSLPRIGNSSGVGRMLKFLVRCMMLAGVPSLCGEAVFAQENALGCAAEACGESTSAAMPQLIGDHETLFANSWPLWTQPTLTGDWFGLRPEMQESGVTFAGRSTHFAFGVDGGINTPVPAPLGMGDTFKYTGRGEYDLIFDLEKFGGLPHGSLLVRAEHWYGDYGNVSLNTGGFAPAVFGAATPVAPNNPGDLYMTNFVITQPLSEELVVFGGKKDVLGGADQDVFAGGDGTDQFVNQAFVANPAFLLGLPYTSFTTGVVMPQDWGMISAFVYDPQDRTTNFLTTWGTSSQPGLLSVAK